MNTQTNTQNKIIIKNNTQKIKNTSKQKKINIHNPPRVCEKKPAPKFVFLFFGILIFGIVPAKTAFAGALWAPHPPSCFVLAQQGSPAGSGAAGPLAFCPKAPNIPYAPRKQVCPLVGISKHWGANSTLLADTQKPQPQLGQNGQALKPTLHP